MNVLSKKQESVHKKTQRYDKAYTAKAEHARQTIKTQALTATDRHRKGFT